MKQIKNVDDCNQSIFKDKTDIIIDLDGTLIDSIGIWNDVDIEMITNEGRTPRNVGLDRDLFLASNTSGDVYVNYAKYILDSYGIDKYTPQQFHEMRCQIAEVYHSERLTLKEGAAEFLKKAREQGHKLTLATITIVRFIDIYAFKNENIRREIDLYEIFNGGVLTKESVTSKKPNPEVYLKALKLSGRSQPDCIVIEDSLSGVQAAKAAAIDTIVMYDKYADCNRSEIEELADYKADNYEVLIRNLRKK